MTASYLTAPNSDTRLNDLGVSLKDRSHGGLVPAAAVLASPPTLTLSATNAATSISGSALNRADASWMRYRGLAMVDAQATTTYAGSLKAGYITSPTPPVHARFVFDTDADKFEVLVQVSATSIMYRVWVDGQPHSLTPTTATSLSGGAFYRLLVDFTTRAPRRLLIEMTNVRVVGIAAHPKSTFWLSGHLAGPKCVVIGDSFTEGTGGTWAWDSWAMEMGNRLGWNTFISGVGGTGYLATANTVGKVKYRDRLAVDVFPLVPDVVVVSGGYNDYSSSMLALRAEAWALLAALKLGLPAAKLFVVLPFTALGPVNFVPHRDAIKAAADAWGVPTIDPVGGAWITGTGTAGGTTGDGNGDFYVTSGSDPHPTAAGHLFLGRRAAAEIGHLL